jgi:hypothetical protein
LAAAERIKWPMKVDWTTSSVEERKDFEIMFLNLLKLQELFVMSTYMEFVLLKLTFLLAEEKF